MIMYGINNVNAPRTIELIPLVLFISFHILSFVRHCSLRLPLTAFASTGWTFQIVRLSFLSELA